MTVKIALAGLGSVGRSFLQLLKSEEQRLAADGIRILVTGAADSSGCITDPDGIDTDLLLQAKEQGGKIADLPQSTAGDLTQIFAGCDIFVDCLPADLPQFASLDLKALGRGLHVVSARKDHLVTLFSLHKDFAANHRRCLRYSAAANAGLPAALDLGTALAKSGELVGFYGVFSSTCNLLLHGMAQGVSFADALQNAQEKGLAEADPSADISGLDTVLKACLCANTFWSDTALQPADFTATPVEKANPKQGEVWKYIAHCRPKEGIFTITPQKLTEDHLLYPLGPRDKAIVFETATQGELLYRAHNGASGTAGTLLADICTVITTMAPSSPT